MGGSLLCMTVGLEMDIICHGGLRGIIGSCGKCMGIPGALGVIEMDNLTPPITPSREYILYGTERGCSYKEGVQL